MSNAASPVAAPYLVTRPRASDAIGVALRDAYAGPARLPDDFAELMRVLNDCAQRR